MPKISFGNRGLEGLKASDRSEADKQYLDTISGDTVTTPSYDFNVQVDNDFFDAKSAVHQYLNNKIAQEELAYNKYLEDYKKKIHVVGGAIKGNGIDADIRDIANKVSPYYKKYKGTDYVNIGLDEWADLAAQYEATKNTYGVETANQRLNRAIKDNVASNQRWYEQLWLGFEGVGASAAGETIAVAGAVKGAIDYFTGNYESKDYLSGFDNFMNSVIDNEVTRYGNDVTQWGSLFPDQIKKAKELGISNLQIVESSDQEDSLFSSATPWLALQSSGFTLASMGIGWGEAKLAGLMFKGLSKTTKAIETAGTITNNLEFLRKAENFTNKFIIPGMVGTAEGLMEGLNTKQQVEQDGINAVREMQSEEVAKEVNRRLSELNKVQENHFDKEGRLINEVKYFDKKGNPVDIDALYQQVWLELSPKYKEALEQVDYAATTAGINNFYVNSAVNGLINSTLKASLQAAPVKKQLQNSRLFGWVDPDSKFKISGSGAGTEVKSELSNLAKAWIVAKEPLGEFTEEYLQSISDATMRGAAENNIHEFIENKYLGDGSAVVGDSFASDYSAAWTALTGSLTDKESIKSGIMGAVSSVMGMPYKVSSAKTGRVNENGKAETTLFGRGLNEKGERESAWDMAKRLTPWRSSVTGSLREIREKEAQGNNVAEALQLFFRDPDNKDKFDGLVGTYNWAKLMGDAAKGNDEFGYRNSTLGKTINDIMMLQKLKGTKYYDSFMNQLIEVANLEKDTDSANSYIQSMKDNVNTKDESMSDDEIFETLKKNAKLMLSTIDKVQKESDNLDRLLGNVDNDTKQTLIYSQMMLEDWKERRNTLKKELADIKINNSRSSSNLTKEQRELVSKYGSLENAIKELKKLNSTIVELEGDIKDLKDKGKLTKKEKDILKEKKAKYKSAKKYANKLEKDYNSSEVLDGSKEETQDILNEEDIMSLDPISRAIMLKRGKAKTYLATHSKEEYSTKKKELTEELNKLEAQLETHLDEEGFIKKHHNKKAKELKNQIDTTRKKLNDLQADEKQYFSDEQQAVIDNIIAEGTSQDRDFFSKVVDLGRMESSIKTFYDQYNAILSDQDSFNDFVFSAKNAAADIAIKRKYESINKIEDYSSFANELDKVYREGTAREKAVLTGKLKKDNNEFFNRYINEKELLSGLINHVSESENFEDLSDNDIDMFGHTLTYLSSKGVDLNNDNEVIEALSKTDENGVLEFKKYVEDVNASLEEVNRTAFTSVGEAIQNFKNIRDSYIKQQGEIKANNEPIVVTSTTPEQAAPVKHTPPVQSDDKGSTIPPKDPVTTPPTTPPSNPPQSGGTVFDNAATSADDSFLGKDGKPITNDNVDGKDKAPIQNNPIINNFRNNSSEEIAKAAEVVLRVIENSPRISKDTKDRARAFIEELSTNSYDTVEEFTDDINSKANTLEVQSDNGVSEEASLLRQASSRALANELKDKKVGEPKKKRSTYLLQKIKGEIDTTTQNINTFYNMFPGSNTNSGFIASINIDKTRQDNPDSAIVKYYNKYEIEEALRDGVLKDNSEILFITDEELTKDSIEDFKKKNVPYNAEISLPIVAVVKSDSGNLIIDGVHYQPIGIMPSTNKQGSAGSAYMAPIRKLALANKESVQIIKDENGKPIVTKPYGTNGTIRAYPVDKNYRGSNSVISIGIKDLEQEESDPQKAAEKARERFFKGVIVIEKDGVKKLYFRQSKLNGGYNFIEIFNTPISESTSIHSNATFSEALESDDPLEIIKFNSRTRRAASEFNTFIDSLKSTNEMVFDSNLNDATKEALSKLGDYLDRKISNYINIPYNYGWTYSVVPTSKFVDGNRVMIINLFNTNTKETIPLVTVHAGMTKEERVNAQAVFLKNIIADNGTIRMVGKDNPFAKWTTPYHDIEKRSEDSNARNNSNDVYNDNIFYAAATSFNYRIRGFAVQVPFGNNTTTPVNNDVANPSNAQNPGPINKPTIVAKGQVSSGGATVDSDSGAVLEGTPSTPINQYQENAKKKIKKINDESKQITLNNDEDSYISTIDGTRYAKDTSILSEIKPDNIEIEFKSLVRDFLSGKIDDDFKIDGELLPETYPSITIDQVKYFKEQLTILKNTLTAKGFTIGSIGANIPGNINIVDSEEALHSIKVAGTIDLIAYDAKGDFHIFNVKISKGENTRLLSLHKELLESRYGIKVKSVNIIPINTSNYEITDDDPLPIVSKVELQPIIDVTNDVGPLFIDWENLSDSERENLKKFEEEIIAQTGEQDITPVAAGVANTEGVDKVDPLLGTEFDGSYIGDMFGINSDDFNDFSNFDMDDTHRPIPTRLQWGVWEGFTNDDGLPIDVETTIKNLEKLNYTKEMWDSLDDNTLEHILKCSGAF